MKRIIPFISYLIIALIVLTTGGIYAYLSIKNLGNHEQLIACTQEAKQCPDGSYVSRIGTKCEFASCPIAEIQNDTFKVVPNNIKSDEKQLSPAGNILVPIAKDFQAQNLPSDVDPHQISTVYTFGGKLYAMVEQTNMNTYLPGLEDGTVKWHGVIVSHDNGTSWQKLFTVKDPLVLKESILFNAKGIFPENNKLYLDIVDAHGAGSGEGNLVRFFSSDEGKTWKREGCYYFIPENYYAMSADQSTPNGIGDPHLLKSSKSCVY